MGNPVIRSTEAGFSEFIALLVSGTMDSVVTSLCEQEKKVTELEQCSRLSPKEFQQHCMPEDQIRAEVIRYFPDPAGRAGRSAVDKGEPYRKKTREGSEYPSVFSLTGYEIRDNDLEKCPSGLCFTKEGQEAITRTVGALAAAQELAALQTIVSRGIPRVYIDHGKIAAKMMIKVEEGTVSAFTRGARPAFKNLIVQPVNASRPEFLSLKTDIISEVEITFKSITR
jgi:hypothetical protein